MSNIKDDALLSAHHLYIYIPDGPVVSGYHQTDSCEDGTFFFVGSCSLDRTQIKLTGGQPDFNCPLPSLIVSSTDRYPVCLPPQRLPAGRHAPPESTEQQRPRRTGHAIDLTTW
jgi:hypothetical protein